MNDRLRELVRSRAGGRCEYCRLPQSAVPFAPFQIEHVVARQHGGSDDEGNLALACDRCNLHKGPNLSGVDPVDGTIVQLFHPRRQVWSDHFALRGAEIVGQTDVGRTTVRVLNMNASPRVRLRAELIRSGAYPTA